MFLSLSQKNQAAYSTLIKEQVLQKIPRHWAIENGHL